MKRSLKLLGVVLLAVMLWPVRVPAHDVYLPVIIDTDAAADDLRAIAMLLNTGSADIRLIVASDGVLAADAARQSVQRLLNCLGYRRIPVVTGVNLPLAAPEFRELNGSLNWPDCGKQAETGANTDGLSASRAIVSAVNAVPDEVLYLCLGPMTNLAASFKTDPGIISKIHRVVYMGGAPDSATHKIGFHKDHRNVASLRRQGAKVRIIERFIRCAGLHDSGPVLRFTPWGFRTNLCRPWRTFFPDFVPRIQRRLICWRPCTIRPPSGNGLPTGT